MFMAEGKVHAGSLSAFPAGLRVLVVDDDLTCLSCLARLLQACRYQVTKCQLATEALSLLREKESEFDIVISDIYMPDMDGFRLLEIIRFEMDLPVVMMSNDNSKDVVMKVITMGACDYLVKPLRKEEISVIWQHVVRKQKNDLKSFMLSKFKPSGEEYQNKSSPEEENCGSSNHVKIDEDEGCRNDIVSLKKQRMVWTTELHDQFVAAVNDIGLKNAVPKKILELMKVPGLTRENVASHLQKYRIFLRRKTENNQKKFCNPSAQIQNVVHPCMVGSSTSQTYAISNHQLQSQSSVVSHADVEPERLSIVTGGGGTVPITQGNCYHQPWYYGIQVNLAPPYGTPPAAIESEQDDITMLQQRGQSLNGTHFSLPIPSLMVDVEQNYHGNNLSSYDCSADGTDQNASFATVRNTHSEFTLSSSGYDSVFLVQHYNQEDLTET